MPIEDVPRFSPYPEVSNAKIWKHWRIMIARGRYWPDQLSSEELAILDPGLPAHLDHCPDVLVVGGGIVGVATAVACKDAAIGSVLLIESDRLGAGATGGAAGLLIPEAQRADNPMTLVDLGRESLDIWRQVEATLPRGIGLENVDWIGLEPHIDNILVDPPREVQWLDIDAVSELLPGLAEPTKGALIPFQARLNPMRALARLAVEIPQVATPVSATAIAIRGRRAITVSTTAGTISPGAVVFATGSPPILHGLDLSVPSDSIKGHLLVADRVPIHLPGIVATLGTQLAEGRILAGGTLDVDDSSPTVRPEVISSICGGVSALLPRLRDIRVTHQWCCRRPHHPDGLPVIDRIPGLDNAWVTSGHYRSGILLAPAVGKLIAQWISTNHRPFNAAPWALERLGMGV